MGAREAVVLLHDKKKQFLSCPNSAVNISKRCSTSKKKNKEKQKRKELACLLSEIVTYQRKCNKTVGD